MYRLSMKVGTRRTRPAGKSFVAVRPSAVFCGDGRLAAAPFVSRAERGMRMWTRQRRRSPDGVCRRARAPRPTIALLIACLVGLAVPAAAQTGVDVDLGAIDGLSPPSAKSSGAIKLKTPGAPPGRTAPSPAPAKPAPSASTAPASTPPAPDSSTPD